MKRLLNTLFVTTQGAYLRQEGETVCVRVERETRLRVPVHTLGGIVCFGQVSCSPPLMRLCGERNVLVSFHSEHGRFLGRVHGPVSGNVLLRREQYRRADDLAASARIARAVVLAKVANCRTALMRAGRDHADTTDARALTAASAELSRIAGEVTAEAALDSLRGREGDAARVYFGVFDHLIVAQKESFRFHERSRRPPLDSINALLSFLYAMLAHDVASALESVGLDPAVGFLHRDRPGRPSLALDLMEELRPVLADRVALALVNLQQVKADGFRKTETGAVMMDDKTRKAVLVAWQKRKADEVRHPFLDEKMAFGLVPYAQALLLARHLRGDLDGYPAFFWK
ncbi:MAG TPA: type I-C CRISPR-associated endonuclease Cas1 [candidate division WOR-3 bacterium]|uniref:CRISPR-associated endonuclease Cas1 n=1 Tax=candidate division WOR-3 bacterium TaxID=2052148 RepID=A0A7V0T6M3_UNCW3|nr:type I-C CRISPR-associated endonuclease Cas1 [candidate division WOR-3 bacterium]